jgi:hypothetical protein
MSGWFGGILGQREAPPAAEILIERLQDSHKIEDRRKTVADLKSVADKENHAVCIIYLRLMTYLYFKFCISPVIFYKYLMNVNLGDREGSSSVDKLTKNRPWGY